MRTLLWGAGGHAKVVLDVIRTSGDSCEVVFVDSNARLAGGTFLGCRVYPTDALAQLQEHEQTSFLVCIGDNLVRSRHYDELRASGWQPAIAIHPTAIVSASASIGRGTVIMPRAVVNAYAEVGENCIINTGAIVEHDCRIGSHAHVSPGATLGGGVVVEPLAHIGLNASVLPGLSVGRGSIAGAGAVITRRVPENVVVAGVPARIQNSRSI